MSGQRQKNRPEQGVLAFPAEGRSDAPKAVAKGTETLMAKHRTESLAGTERLMEEVCELENCKQAFQRVKANKGSPGVDGMTVDELPEYLKQHGLEIGEQLRTTAAGKAGGNPKAGRQWSAKIRHSLCAGQVRPAGSVAGSAEALGPDVLRTQPRFSTGAQCEASGARGAAVYRRRKPLGGGPRLGRNFSIESITIAC